MDTHSDISLKGPKLSSWSNQIVLTAGSNDCKIGKLAWRSALGIQPPAKASAPFFLPPSSCKPGVGSVTLFPTDSSQQWHSVSRDAAGGC